MQKYKYFSVILSCLLSGCLIQETAEDESYSETQEEIGFGPGTTPPWSPTSPDIDLTPAYKQVRWTCGADQWITEWPWITEVWASNWSDAVAEAYGIWITAGASPVDETVWCLNGILPISESGDMDGQSAVAKWRCLGWDINPTPPVPLGPTWALGTFDDQARTFAEGIWQQRGWNPEPSMTRCWLPGLSDIIWPEDPTPNP